MSGKYLIYGATGYVGGLILENLKTFGLQPVVAGRSKEKVMQLAGQYGLEGRTFGLDHPADIDKGLQDIDAVLHLAGPFSKTAKPMVEGCIRNGAHYLDIAGEVNEFELVRTFHEQAKDKGIMLMPGVGFGVVPTDCLALYLKKSLPSATELKLAIYTEGGTSRGTLKTVLGDLTTVGVVRKQGAFLPSRPGEEQLYISFGKDIGRKKAVTNPWRADLTASWNSTGIPNISTYMSFPAPLRSVMRSGLLSRLWESSWLQNRLMKMLDKVQDGPTPDQLLKGRTAVWGEVRDGHGNRKEALLRGPDAYYFTMVTALSILKDVLAGNVLPGFQTPAGVFGEDYVLQFEGVERS